MTEYLIRAKLEFDWDFEEVGRNEQLRRPHTLPISIGPFQLNESPNSEFYLDEVAQVELDRISQGYPDWRYPVSLLYFERKLQVPTKGPPYAQANETFEHLEWLLRLFQPGGISVRRHQHIFGAQEKKFTPFFYFTGHSPQPVSIPLYERPPYPLDDAIVDSFVAFFNKFWNVLQENLSSYLTIALSRFNSSYEKSSLADRLIDLVIALEAMFSDRKSRSISHDVATRCAGWLHSAEDERPAALRFVKKMYNDRSDVVHGEGQVKLCKKQVDDLEDIARASLVKFLDSRASGVKTPNGKEIDSLMMTGKI